MTFFSNPKRKDYVLNPRGKALYDDSNRFGTKMLEKMGWSKGKGLGAKLDGQLDFIKVSHKGDQKGVGFKDRDDQWTTHESNFNSLLSSFKSTENSDQDDQQLQDCVVQHFQSEKKTSKKEKVEETVELFSGVSLEEQSKNSRARVHYKKFTRGKDLARYSEKDLANIFGKKSLKNNAEADEPTVESAVDDKVDESNENTPNFGITTIETGTTITDYFKNKMKNFVNGSQKSSEEQVSNVESVSVFSNKKEKKNRKKSKTTGAESQDSETDANNTEIRKETTLVVVDQASVSESKKTKKRKHDNDNIEESKSAKKKKNKSIEQVVGTVDDESKRHDDNETQSAPKKSKKNKKQKVGSFNDDESVETNKATENGNEVGAEEDCEIVNVEVEENHHSKKKSKKRNGDDESQSNNETSAGNDINDVEKVRPHKKSKKGRESKQIESCNNVPAGQPTSNLFDYVAKVADEQNVPEVVTDNVYEIRRYRTEIFRYVDLAAFPGSTLSDIPGYGYTNEITLKVVEKPNDNQLINTLWNDAQDKYANGGKQKKKKFVEHIGDLKKKNVFKI